MQTNLENFPKEHDSEIETYIQNTYCPDKLFSILKVVPSTYENPDAVSNTINYVSSHAIENGCNGVGCSALPDEAIYDFYRIKALFGKTDGKQVKHLIVAFEAATAFNANSIVYIAWNIASYFYNLSHQVFYGIHELQTEGRIAYHIHFIINTVSFTNGLRLNCSPESKAQFLQYIEALPYDFTIVPINSYF